MTTQHIIEPGQAVHQAAAILSSLEYINQAEARSHWPKPSLMLLWWCTPRLKRAGRPGQIFRRL